MVSLYWRAEQIFSHFRVKTILELDWSGQNYSVRAYSSYCGSNVYFTIFRERIDEIFELWESLLRQTELKGEYRHKGCPDDWLQLRSSHYPSPDQ